VESKPFFIHIENGLLLFYNYHQCCMTRKITIGIIAACITCTATAIFYRKMEGVKSATVRSTPPPKVKNAALFVQSRATAIKNYLRNNNYNQEICFFIDMGLAPGKSRFFTYDLKKGIVLNAGLVAHGSGGKSTFEDAAYSNSIGSNCTSLGRYKIGQSYYGQFGLAYKLHGLDKTNSNAFNRFVVLHAHDCIPTSEIFPDNICMSWGCPTVAPAFLSQLATHINKSGKPILLEIYDSRQP
jgi:hypothetical protein